MTRGTYNIFKALDNGDLEAVKHFIENGTDVNAKDNKGFTPIHIAVGENGNLELVKYLVDHGADINVKGRNEWTVLHIAASENGNLEIVKYLVCLLYTSPSPRD